MSENRIICADMDSNAIFEVNLSDGAIGICGCIPGEQLFADRLVGCVYVNGKDYIFVPYKASKIWVLNTNDNSWKSIELDYPGVSYKFYNCAAYGETLYLIPVKYPEMLALNLNDYSLTKVDIPLIADGRKECNDAFFFSNCVKENNLLYLASCETNAVIVFNMENRSYEWKNVGSPLNRYVGICKHDGNFWLAPRKNTPIVMWDGQKNVKEIDIASMFSGKFVFWGITDTEGITLHGIDADETVSVDESLSISENRESAGTTFADVMEDGTFVMANKNCKLTVSHAGETKEINLEADEEQVSRWINIYKSENGNSNQVIGETEFFGLNELIDFIM
ncbi:MAG: hypothetical protein MJ119_03915 [Lachnospiraceae bacterium]|nr:hypothetical protein [Lachnospiraceae bacterium]